MVAIIETILPAWREGKTRTAILDFFDSIEQIPPDERVAVFDNDGTMWCEKPNYTQVPSHTLLHTA